MINIVETTSISNLNLGEIKEGIIYGKEENELIYQDDEGKTKQIANLYPFPLYKLIDNIIKQLKDGYIKHKKELIERDFNDYQRCSKSN